MKHFEDIWNSAEALGRKLPKQEIPDLVANIKKNLDKIADVVTMPIEQAELLGDVIFDICVLTDNINANSAAALRMALENRKAQLLDPDDDDDNEENTTSPATPRTMS